MKHYLRAITFILAISLTSLSYAGPYDSDQQSYMTAGQKIIDMVNNDRVDVEKVKAEVLETLKASVKLGQAYTKVHPESKAIIEEVIKKAAVMDQNGNVTGIGDMGQLTFAEIEADWHDAGYFSKNKIGVSLQNEDNEHILDPMHTIIHPIMVYVAAKDYVQSKNAGSLNAMKAEMQEGLEQIGNTMKVVNK